MPEDCQGIKRRIGREDEQSVIMDALLRLIR